jgi:hypothetical protein
MTTRRSGRSADAPVLPPTADLPKDGSRASNGVKRVEQYGVEAVEEDDE